MSEDKQRPPVRRIPKDSVHKWQAKDRDHDSHYEKTEAYTPRGYGRRPSGDGDSFRRGRGDEARRENEPRRPQGYQHRQPSWLREPSEERRGFYGDRSRERGPREERRGSYGNRSWERGPREERRGSYGDRPRERGPREERRGSYGDRPRERGPREERRGFYGDRPREQGPREERRGRYEGSRRVDAPFQRTDRRFPPARRATFHERDQRFSAESHAGDSRNDGASSGDKFAKEQSQGEVKAAEFLREDRLEGRNPVQEALRAGRSIDKLWVQRAADGRVEPTLGKIVRDAREAGAVIVEVDRQALDKMTQTHAHQGVIAQTAMHEYADLDAVFALAEERGEAPFILVLDEIKDAYNLGGVLRIAEAAGVHGVIIPKRRAVGLDAIVAKSSAGAMEHVLCCRVNNLRQTIAELKERGCWIAGTAASGAKEYTQADLSGSLALVIGSEGEGMRPSVEDDCDFKISIPMRGEVNSLNAAVAAAVIVFEALRQRNASEVEGRTGPKAPERVETSDHSDAVIQTEATTIQPETAATQAEDASGAENSD